MTPSMETWAPTIICRMDHSPRLLKGRSGDVVPDNCGSGGNTVSGADKAFKMAVMKIRNSIAYHYYQPKKLVQGYKKHSSSPRSEHNALAYSSFGKNMEESRFYFADAAAEHAVNTYRRMSTERFSKQLQKYVAAANE